MYAKTIVCVLVYYNVFAYLNDVQYDCLLVSKTKNGNNEMKNWNIKLEHNVAEVWYYKIEKIEYNRIEQNRKE